MPCFSGGNTKTTPPSPSEAPGKETERGTLSRCHLEITFRELFSLSPGKAVLHLFLSGKMSGSGLHWNCLSNCRPECFPLFASVCDLNIDFKVERLDWFLCYSVQFLHFFLFCLNCIANFKSLVGRGLWLSF